jgi:hypothetical protein
VRVAFTQTRMVVILMRFVAITDLMLLLSYSVSLGGQNINLKFAFMVRDDSASAVSRIFRFAYLSRLFAASRHLSACPTLSPTCPLPVRVTSQNPGERGSLNARGNWGVAL